MSIRLGILGADDTLEVIRSVASEYPELICIPVVYGLESEVIEKLTPFLGQVDMWLFSGQVPYSIAKEWGKIDKPMFYIPQTGASLYRTLLYATSESGLKVNELSFDTFHEKELERAIEEAGLSQRHRFLKYYQAEISAEELADYHYELWKSGQTKGAVTCLRTAHLELLRRGMPVFRVLPARSAVEAILNLILLTDETLHFKERQIAVQMIDALPLNHGKDGDLIGMVEYSKKIHGSLKQLGRGRYIIFTTSGLLQEATGNFTEIPSWFELHQNLVPWTCGIGIGQNAYEAEIYAEKALMHAKEHGEGTWMVFFEDKTIVGPLGTEQQIRYATVSDQLQSMSEETTLGISTLSKIESILKKQDTSTITAHDLARHMLIMPRSARRILTLLENKGYAEVIAEDTPHPRGRPRKIYRLLFSNSEN